MNRKHLVTVLALVGFVLPLVGQAGMQGDLAHGCKERPLTDFLDAQGTTQFFFPPVQDMLAWTDAAFVNFAVVDYAGLADNYVESATGSSLGTGVNGRVLECATGDGGPVKISVVLSTRKALGFAQSIQDLINSGFDFLNTPTTFGVKAQDVVNNGDAPALGPATLRVTFFIAEAGGPLPDIRIAFQANEPDVRPITVDFRSTTVGRLSDGTKSRMRIQQVGATDANGEDLVFSREIIDFSKN